MPISKNELKVDLQIPLQDVFRQLLTDGTTQAGFRVIRVNDRGEEELVDDVGAFNSAIRSAHRIADGLANTLADRIAQSIVKHVRRADITCTIPMAAIKTPSGGAGPPAPKNISGTLR